MFNTILNTGIVSPSWKHSYIEPIPKNGSKSDITNYRGIALQSCIPKVFDKLIAKLIKHLSSILPKKTTLFSSETKYYIEFDENHTIQQQLAMKNQLDVIYFDFSKAFDTIDRYILAVKLAKLSMPYSIYGIHTIYGNDELCNKSYVHFESRRGHPDFLHISNFLGCSTRITLWLDSIFIIYV